MVLLQNHTNDLEDHTTTYDSGTSYVVLIFGLVFIAMVVTAPQVFGTEFYAPLNNKPVLVVKQVAQPNTPNLSGLSKQSNV